MNIIRILIFALPLIAITAGRVINTTTTITNLQQIKASRGRDSKLPRDFLDLKNTSSKSNTTTITNPQQIKASRGRDSKLPRDFLDLKNTSSKSNTTNDMTVATVARRQRRSVPNKIENQIDMKFYKPVVELVDFAVRLWRFLVSLITRDNFYLLRRFLFYVSKMADFMGNFMPEHPMQRMPLKMPQTSSVMQIVPEWPETGYDYYANQEYPMIQDTLNLGGDANETDQKNKIHALKLKFLRHLGYWVLRGYLGLSPPNLPGTAPGYSAVPDYQY